MLERRLRGAAALFMRQCRALLKTAQQPLLLLALRQKPDKRVLDFLESEPGMQVRLAAR